jgi:ribosome-binding protein aMBF1 (putative translation factor)
MAKYSTGDGGGGGDGDACELCGTESNRLSKANVAGAELLVCPDCSPHDDSRRDSSSRGGQGNQGNQGSSGSGSSSSGSDSSVDRKKRAAQKQAEIYDAQQGDSSHWEKEGTNYERDRLPYLVSDYDERVETARQDAGLTVEELADELGIDDEEYLAVEQGRAARAGVGGSVIREIEDELDVRLVDE